MPPKLHAPESLAYPLLELKTQAAWRRWLSKKHDKSSGVNFVHYKKDSGVRGVSYEEALDEALCFGWIDSTIRKIDEMRYVHQFTPRKPGSFWSDVNKRKVAALIAKGKMTEHGAKFLPSMKDIGAAVKAGPAKTAAPKQVELPTCNAYEVKRHISKGLGCAHAVVGASVRDLCCGSQTSNHSRTPCGIDHVTRIGGIADRRKVNVPRAWRTTSPLRNGSVTASTNEIRENRDSVDQNERHTLSSTSFVTGDNYVISS
jgi:hypothetical protein